MKKLLFIISLLVFPTLWAWVGVGYAQLCFSPVTSFNTGTNSHSVISADFNGDTKLDLAVANYTSNDVSILLGDGLGNFAAATNFTVGTNPLSVTSGDFNGDGNADLAVANMSSNNV